MARGAELIIKIGAESSKFRKELQKIEKEADDSTQRMASRAKLAAGSIAVVTAAGVAATSAIANFAKFESDFSNVVTLLDKGSFKTKTFNEGIESLSSGLLDVAAQTGQSLDVLNKGLFDLISAGVDAEKSIEALGVAADLAIAGATDTSVAVDGLTSALNAYSLDADQAQSVAEKFFTAQKFGKTTIEELSASFGQVGATAAAFGVSLDEVLASVSAATTAGIGTSEAFTGLKAILSNIAKPTKDAAIEAQRLGIEFDQAALKSLGLKGFLDQVTNSAKFNDESLTKLFGSVEALNIATALAGNQAASFEGVLKSLNDETQLAETYQDALAAKTQTVEFQYNRLTQELENTTVSLGKFLSEALNVAGNLGRAADGIRDFRDVVRETNDALSRLSGFGERKPITIAGQDSKGRPTLDNAQYADFDKAQEAIANQGLNDIFGVAGDSGSLDDVLERLRTFNEEKNQILSDSLEEETQIKVDAKENAEGQGITTDLARQTDEEFDENFDKLKDRIEREESVRKKAESAREAAAKKHARDLIRIEEEKKRKLEQLDLFLHRSLISNAEQTFGKQTAIGKALFLVRKAIAIKEVIVNTQAAMALARATIPPPGGDIQAAKYAIQGAVSTALIAAQAIEGIKAQNGGIVPGIGSGDRVPALLEPGEIVIPKKFNPLSPNFEETFGAGSGSEVNVMIGIEEDASRIITVKQREDRKLGISQ